MVGLSRAVAAELAATAVRVHAVCAGFVDTDITRQAAAAIAARGKQTPEEALGKMGAMNTIGRLHTAEEVAEAVIRLVRERPQGCIYNLDQEPPGFV
jgi:NAD(P)-dependent dehydrogenase (short-subunit alcohol dehydrogenase family)